MANFFNKGKAIFLRLLKLWIDALKVTLTVPKTILRHPVDHINLLQIPSLL
jgi:hypothetical protein